jgi:GntR family transcriptional regulator
METAPVVEQRPLHVRIADDLRGRITSGELPPGEWLPSEKDLQERYGTSRTTTRNALKTLVHEGLITSVAARGYYVREHAPLVYYAARSERPAHHNEAALDSWMADVREQGRRPGQQLEVFECVPPAEVAAALELEKGAAVIARRQVRLVDGEPYALSTAYFPHELVKDTPLAQLHEVPSGLSAALAELGYQAVRVVDVNQARPPTPQEAEILRLSPGVAVLYQRRTSYTAAGQPFRCTVGIWPGDRFVMHYELNPGDT